uniref:MARVEL domain-containing protein n=1 Tax=Elaeophora elaphi TaxID=1147741 RepID=A0A0R3RPR7_9BILA
MEERKLRLLTIIAATIFQLANITSAVLALVIWDYNHYRALWNIAYYGALILSTSITTAIVIMLLRGMHNKQPYLMLPFIVYCSLQAAISLLFLSYFISTALLQYWLSGTFSSHAVQLIAIFISVSLYWITSLRIVREQRQQIQKSMDPNHKSLV